MNANRKAIELKNALKIVPMSDAQTARLLAIQAHQPVQYQAESELDRYLLRLGLVEAQEAEAGFMLWTTDLIQHL